MFAGGNNRALLKSPLNEWRYPALAPGWSGDVPPLVGLLAYMSDQCWRLSGSYSHLLGLYLRSQGGES